MENTKLRAALLDILEPGRVKTKLIDVVSYAADAGFYYLRPQAVVLPVSEAEVAALFALSHKLEIPLVFRAAGTSLSGQAVTDGILVDLSQHWTLIRPEDAGKQVRVQPGAIGAIVNAQLRRYGRKIGPDPASINSAMMGGILSNNSSGMCCGVTKNAYHTLKYIRFVLPDGKVFSTENPADFERFAAECPALQQELLDLRASLLADETAAARIRQKYRTKNTVGYAVNAFLDFEEPLEIMAHLLVGAEGTLGFISEAVLHTVPDFPEKSAALLYFPDIYAACQAIVPLSNTGAEAIELMDRASLRSVEHIAGLPAILKDLPSGAAALLVEYQAGTPGEILSLLEAFDAISDSLSLLAPAEFSSDPVQQALFWKVRKGMFPAVGAVRASGTTVILEDIAFPVAQLGDAIIDLQQLFSAFDYQNAIIFGHAKDGNIHFVVTQAFDTPSEIDRYDRFLRAVVELVVNRYDGTLKAEHGTGRNMSPFVETEWGGVIYEVMRRLKAVADPANLLNPGVIINTDAAAHIRDLKELPKVEEEVDRCMECGFCEHKCPSRDITLTPRKRIVVRRELVSLKNKGKAAAYKTLLDQYQYEGLDTCAVDGLCATACPVDINTGDLVKRLRKENHSAFANRVALFTARHFAAVSETVRFALGAGQLVNRVFGPRAMTNLTSGLKKIVPGFPLWTGQLRPAPALRKPVLARSAQEVVYFPSCISRVMGDADRPERNVMDDFYSLSAKAGIAVTLPSGLAGNCCGQIYSSKGFKDARAYSSMQTVDMLFIATRGGEVPVVLDISSCTQTLLSCRPVLDSLRQSRFDSLTIIDSVEYIHQYVMPRCKPSRKKERITLHPVCSLQKLPGLENKFKEIAQAYAVQVDIPLHAGCCGMAGDRGFLFPELTHAATRKEAADVSGDCDGYYSSSKTCEMALSEAVGKNYRSVLSLVNDCTD
ncbi:FAD-binding oxidoreductase [Pedobacter yulinensis]|uniref:D-lactate dehydrogenase (cytochrome) n=1 Tax=Pedobacter yulinensis TaxID=2126353 RepID=A0A2T3HGJ6_9SPHI|nr:FAD-binding and (Fe-S)-binding domain-containing protein [Pedobacter yulinensis]PST81559.1 FAD-binding oxidoreductase [Pedobacter yulinensis]